MRSSDLLFVVLSVLVLRAFGFDITRYDNVSVVFLLFANTTFVSCSVPFGCYTLYRGHQLTFPSFQINPNPTIVSVEFTGDRDLIFWIRGPLGVLPFLGRNVSFFFAHFVSIFDLPLVLYRSLVNELIAGGRSQCSG